MKRLFRTFFVILIIVGAGFLAEVLYFGLLLNKSDSHQAADTIFILNGASERIKQGYELAAENNASIVVISPADDSMIKAYEKRYEPLKATYILENSARTTFENAYLISKIISAYRLRSITLVTSDYHMPRSYLLLRLMLLGKGVTVQRLAAKSPHLAGSSWPWSEKALKVTYNEMVKLWGSLGEWAFCIIANRLPVKSPKEYPVVQWMKKMLLFDV